ncbi:protein TonB [Novosphingobium sp. PhB165]|uniref:energy transducer TonB n=1 Tax=Novosphingobium sp. PhB165 TaxID=2485105 RepID=UPI00104A3D8F|nr:TonB family protein [Novosphingobium sp. PhB165]TCM20395.1 protein TonB [Novosphingobium sp. PhB165]
MPCEPQAERLGYRPAASGRFYGLIGTVIVYALAASGFLVAISFVATRPPAAPALAVVNLRTAASPPEKTPEKQDAPKPVENKPLPAEPQKVPPPLPVAIPIVSVPAPTAAVTKPAAPAPQQTESAAPRTLPAPPAPQVASNAPDTWEGRVLAALNQHRHYPAMARSRHQQGIPYVRFVMDRQGKVLSCRLERSSGFPDLDREAVSLPKRAEPLPKPPAERIGDTVELVVPVEFLLS